MSMDALKEKLKELHLALSSAEAPDAELVQLLDMLDGDIRNLVQKQAPGANEGAGLASQAQSISARFAAKHPHIAPVLRDLTDMLASMGI
ncbi:MAG TPA: DUF4404 family protein [Burkholderiaceae bacterium]|jgi:hypothetical protein